MQGTIIVSKWEICNTVKYFFFLNFVKYFYTLLLYFVLLRLESMKAWIRPMGIASIVMGVGCELTDLSSFANTVSVPGWFMPVGIGLMIVGAIMGLAFNKIFLKKIK
ncbi:MAG: hypothetical protein PHN80_07865 [Hespellia sp.]|nr:hypothetical protein [Hespellia sp.]